MVPEIWPHIKSILTDQRHLPINTNMDARLLHGSGQQTNKQSIKATNMDVNKAWFSRFKAATTD